MRFEGGLAFADFSHLTRDQATAIQEIIIDEYVNGRGDEARKVRRIRFKLCDKLRALELLGRYQKLLTCQHEHDLSEDLEQHAGDLRDLLSRVAQPAVRQQ